MILLDMLDMSLADTTGRRAGIGAQMGLLGTAWIETGTRRASVDSGSRASLAMRMRVGE
jgi:hypothetical protein